MSEPGSECPACGVHLPRTADEYTHSCLGKGVVRYAVYYPTGDYVLVAATGGETSEYVRHLWDSFNYRVIKFVGHVGIGIALEEEIVCGDLWLEENAYL